MTGEGDRRQQDTLEQEQYQDKLNAESKINLFLFKAERGMATADDTSAARTALRLLGVNV